MKAQELRIGNWILPKMKEYKSEWKAVSLVPDIAIQPVPIQVFPHLITRMVFNEDTSEMYEPIPLTEEWLLKLGFSAKNWYSNFEHWSDTWFQLSSSVIKANKERSCFYFDNEMINIEIKYVHQLQNLYFALTGEELTFKSE